MEKRSCKIKKLNNKKIKRIVLTGPESTGKTELSFSLAEKLGAVLVPEYARQYVEGLQRPYNYDDVVKIAKYQVAQEKEMASKIEKGIMVFDTWLIITKVWFDVVYGVCPPWVADYIRSSEIDLFLVCGTDLPWIADPVRENGGEKREALFRAYVHEIRSFNFYYEVIEGIGTARLKNALNALSKHGI